MILWLRRLVELLFWRRELAFVAVTLILPAADRGVVRLRGQGSHRCRHCHASSSRQQQRR